MRTRCGLDRRARAPQREEGTLVALANDDHRSPSVSHVSLCAIVPTRNEAGNVREVTRRLTEALDHVPAEILFVDDSDDETPDVVRDLASIEGHRQVRLLHRAGAERTGGLGGAVLAGLRAADAEWVCVLDGDLQHPPEVVPELLAAARASGADLVIGTRYTDDGHADGLTAARTAVSRSAAAAAHALFPQRLRGVSDPMSGFFLVRRSALDLATLEPRGFKILLEILVASPWLSVTEVGFDFAHRHAGASKATWQEGVRYGRSLARLRLRTLPASTRPPAPAPVAPAVAPAPTAARAVTPLGIR
jgi:dolichol-phosphate mannosyltransferase